MKVLAHHIYEYRKGLRNLILHTLGSEYRSEVERRLRSAGIAFEIYPVGPAKINVFFGAEECLEVVRSFGRASLSDFTPEEDFILGVMLGYDRLLQCRRYLGRKAKRRASNVDALRECA